MLQPLMQTDATRADTKRAPTLQSGPRLHNFLSRINEAMLLKNTRAWGLRRATMRVRASTSQASRLVLATLLVLSQLSVGRRARAQATAAKSPPERSAARPAPTAPAAGTD